MPAPSLDADLRVGAIAEPLQREMLVAQLAVEGFVGAVLPRLSGVDERRLDLGALEPSENRPRHELGSVVGTEVAQRPVDTDELHQHFDDPSAPNAAGDIDRETLARELVDDRQAL